MIFKHPKINQAPEKDGLYVRNLFKSYKNTHVLDGIDLHLKCGEAVALMGPNGAGKTTCFYAITGLINCDQGEIFIDGINVTHFPIHLRARVGLGYLPQEESIFRDLNVEDNIRAILQLKKLGKQKEEARLESLLEEFSIAHLRLTRATKLSGGERRRLEVARALACDPQYLLLDEPLAGIDPVSIDNINHIITKLKSRGIGVLITDHNVRDALQLVDRAYILYQGRILKQGTPKEVLNDPKTKEVYLGKAFN